MKQNFWRRGDARKGANMLRWGIVFFIIAVVAAFFGFVGVAGVAIDIAKFLFYVFLVLCIISFLYVAIKR